MEIKVRTLTGKEIELNIEENYKKSAKREEKPPAKTPDKQIQTIKERVEEKEGIPPVQQRLIFGGKQMADDKTADDYKLKGGDILHLVLALRGGQS